MTLLLKPSIIYLGATSFRQVPISHSDSANEYNNIIIVLITLAALFDQCPIL